MAVGFSMRAGEPVEGLQSTTCISLDRPSGATLCWPDKCRSKLVRSTHSCRHRGQQKFDGSLPPKEVGKPGLVYLDVEEEFEIEEAVLVAVVDDVVEDDEDESGKTPPFILSISSLRLSLIGLSLVADGSDNLTASGNKE